MHVLLDLAFGNAFARGADDEAALRVPHLIDDTAQPLRSSALSIRRDMPRWLVVGMYTR